MARLKRSKNILSEPRRPFVWSSMCVEKTNEPILKSDSSSKITTYRRQIDTLYIISLSIHFNSPEWASIVKAQ